MNAALPTLMPLGFLAYMLVRRFQRLATPQPLQGKAQRRLLVRPLVLTVVVLGVLAAPHTLGSYASAVLGALLGLGVALYSVRHTRFDYDAYGVAVRYIPNAWIGGGLFALFMGRLLVKLWPMLTGGFPQHLSAQPHLDPTTFIGHSPLTTGLFTLFAAYQVVYSLLVLRRAQVREGALGVSA